MDSNAVFLSAPKVSIGLPVYNGEAFLREALESLVHQDFPDLEIIISENHSSDGTKAIVAEFAARDSRICVYEQPKTLPASDNFAFVLEKARGDYFCWAAHDDVREAGSIRELSRVLDDHSEIVCAMTDVLNFYEEAGKEWSSSLDEIRIEKVQSSWPEVRRKFFAVPTSNIFFCVYGLFRTDTLRKVSMHGNLKHKANSEIPMLAEVALLGRIASIPVEGLRYRRHKDSIYHLETADQSRDVALKRRNILRRLVFGIVMRSTLDLGEKVKVANELFCDFRKDIRAERVNQANQRKRLAKGSKSKRRESPPHWRRWSARFRRAIGGRIAVASRKHPVRDVPPLPNDDYPNSSGNERLVRRKLDLDDPKLKFGLLVKRERERARLESTGWTFMQPKRLKLITDRRITTLLDCGSNSGQYVEELKKAGWSGKVFSFEPLSDAYGRLRAKAEAATDWQTYHFALGDENGESTIQIAGNSYSSSLLQFSADFKELRPDASPVGSETVTIRRLDDVVREEGITLEGPVMLKLDVQGFELSVLRGAVETLKQVSVLQCELALIPSYEGGATFVAVREFLRERGFVLAHLIDGHVNHQTGELREVDGIFLNTRLAPEGA